MENFTPLLSSVGGVLIGLSSVMLLLLSGRVAGISGICGGLLSQTNDKTWRAAFIFGLGSAGFVFYLIAPASFDYGLDRSPWAIAAAGLLVGFGTRLGSGCTSGHGVCGVSCSSEPEPDARRPPQPMVEPPNCRCSDGEGRGWRPASGRGTPPALRRSR